MLKNVSVLIVVVFMTFGSGCSTYNSFVPDWATINVSSDETKSSETSKENGKWWNPFTWF